MISDTKKFCNYFYDATFIPITYYSEKNSEGLSFPVLPERNLFTAAALPILMNIEKRPAYYAAGDSVLFGIVGNTAQGDFVLAGPVFCTNEIKNDVPRILFLCSIDKKFQNQIEPLLENIPVLTLNQFLSMLAMLQYCFNDDSIEYEKFFNLLNVKAQKEVLTEHSNKLMNAKEQQSFHNTYKFERRYLMYVENGEPEKLKQLFATGSKNILQGGTIASTPLRQAKNIFISSITLTTRSAIAGGMDIEQAYQLSDTYINKCERLLSTTDIMNLQYTMNVDFAEQVAKQRLPQSGISSEIFECIQFITQHTNENIHIQNVAEHICRSRSYISTKFKKEMGIDLNSYIMQVRLEEAKNLLTYSDKSLIEISTYLNFSSQCYFQNLFKKKFGLTPLQYRNKSV